MHLAHATHITFENLDILLGRPILLDLTSVTAKLIHACRGGYCFEQNALLAAVLETIGFPVKRLAARVRMGSNEIRPRSHMLLAVDVEGESWLADVGVRRRRIAAAGPAHGARTRAAFWLAVSGDCRWRLTRCSESSGLRAGSIFTASRWRSSTRPITRFRMISP